LAVRRYSLNALELAVGDVPDRNDEVRAVLLERAAIVREALAFQIGVIVRGARRGVPQVKRLEPDLLLLSPLLRRLLGRSEVVVGRSPLEDRLLALAPVRHRPRDASALDGEDGGAVFLLVVVREGEAVPLAVGRDVKVLAVALLRHSGGERRLDFSDLVAAVHVASPVIRPVAQSVLRVEPE